LNYRLFPALPRVDHLTGIERGARGYPVNAVEIVDWAVHEMLVAGFCARQGKALVPPRGPAAHHRVGHLGMKLDAVGRSPVAKCLHLEDIAFGEEVGPGGQVEAFSVPLIDDLRPSLHHAVACRHDPDRIIADLRLAFGVKADRRAEVPGQHLGAEADAEKWLALF
jgi:hypothetical protein